MRIDYLFILISSIALSQVEKQPVILESSLVDVYAYSDEEKNMSPNFYLGFGKNISSFDYKNSTNNENDNVKSSIGNIFEFGVTEQYANLGVNLGLEFKMIEYNAIGNNEDINYEWETTYLGINAISNKRFSIHNRSEVEFQIGLGLQRILGGNQLLGKEVINLSKNNEFDGVFGSIEIGFGLFLINQTNFLGGVYLSYNKAKSLDNDSIENLDFSSLQLKLRLCSKR